MEALSFTDNAIIFETAQNDLLFVPDSVQHCGPEVLADDDRRIAGDSEW